MKLPNNISSRYHKDVLNDTLLLCFSKPTFSFDKTCQKNNVDKLQPGAEKRIRIPL